MDLILWFLWLPLASLMLSISVHAPPEPRWKFNQIEIGMSESSNSLSNNNWGGHIPRSLSFHFWTEWVLSVPCLFMPRIYIVPLQGCVFRSNNVMLYLMLFHVSKIYHVHIIKPYQIMPELTQYMSERNYRYLAPVSKSCFSLKHLWTEWVLDVCSAIIPSYLKKCFVMLIKVSSWYSEPTYNNRRFLL